MRSVNKLRFSKMVVAGQDNKENAKEKVKIFSMIWPIIVELILTGLLANATQAVLNDFSSDAVAVTSSGSLVVSFVLNIYCIISIGMTILLAPLAGAKRYDECRQLINAALMANFFIGIFISLLGITLIPVLIILLNIPDNLHEMARQYLLISIGLSFVQGQVITLNAALRSFGEMKKVLYTMLSVSTICMVLSKLLYLFVPEHSQNMILYSLVSIIAQLAGIVMFFVILYRHKEIKYRFSVKGTFSTIKYIRPRILHYGIPGGCEGLIYLVSQTMVVSFIGLLGTQALLVKAFAGNVYYYMTVTTSSTAAGVSIIAGHLIGEGNSRKIGKISRNLIMADFAVTAAVCAILLIIGPGFLRIYTNDRAIISMAMKVIFLNMIVELIKCVTGNLVSILKAIGDVRFPFVIVIAGSVINVGISYFFGIMLKFGLIGIWFGYIADVLFRGIACWIRFDRDISQRPENEVFIKGL